ncbi:hypothetical protein HOLleu_35548 [Holothuria leucospilota]|uniref:Immunoglobulin domain-containing protein n=1 Tax=Holothuria leucospilota TaxID=206669 RepID=A0A9Q0YJ68_HOLLE|nr:hypothetical protein HOLleu_35548 [Holothuria leucospilota]
MNTALKGILVILLFLCNGYGSDVNTQGRCVEHASLEVGRQGMIKCGLDNFYSLSWYREDDYDAEGSPFISYSNGEKNGQLHQYDVLANGSLTIGNVSVNDAGSYIITVLQEIIRQDIIFQVLVEVSDTSSPPPPVPEPIISGCYHKPDQCVLKIMRKGELSCSASNSHYEVDLQWKLLTGNQTLLLLADSVVNATQQKNNMFETSITTSFLIADESEIPVTIMCISRRSDSGLYLSNATAALVLYNGNGSEENKQGRCVEHASLEVGRQGMIKCGLDNFYSLSWYREDDYDAERSPFISYSNGEKNGQLHQYDVLANGSLTIGNVSVNDAGSYIITVSQEIIRQDIIFQVLVEVSGGSQVHLRSPEVKL